MVATEVCSKTADSYSKNTVGSHFTTHLELGLAISWPEKCECNMGLCTEALKASAWISTSFSLAFCNYKHVLSWNLHQPGPWMIQWAPLMIHKGLIAWWWSFTLSHRGLQIFLLLQHSLNFPEPQLVLKTNIRDTVLCYPYGKLEISQKEGTIALEKKRLQERPNRTMFWSWNKECNSNFHLWKTL